MSLRDFVIDLFDFTHELADPDVDVTWSIQWDVDDFDGPGWYVHATGPDVWENFGRFNSQQEAVTFAKNKATPDDKFEIWEKSADKPETKVYK